MATGTDIKPLEVLIFMRDVMSETLFTQMKGRGVRTIGDEQLRSVTPNAHSKDCFYIVDAVGVTEHAKIVQPVNLNPEEPALSLRRLLELITHGNLEDDNLHLLAGKIARIARKSNPKQLEEFKNLAGCEMKELAENIFKALSEGNCRHSAASTTITRNARLSYSASLADPRRGNSYLSLTPDSSPPSCRAKIRLYIRDSP